MRSSVLNLTRSAAMGIMAWAAGQTARPQQADGPTAHSNSQAPTARPVERARPAEFQVILSDEAPYFSPKKTRVPVNSKVTWINRGPGLVHTMTITTASGTVRSESIFPGKSWAYTFAEEGSFKTSCGVHPYMYGLVLVGDAPDQTLEPHSTAAPPAATRRVVADDRHGSGRPEAQGESTPSTRPTDGTARSADRGVGGAREEEAEFLEFALPVPGSVPGIVEIDQGDYAWFTMGGGGWANIAYPPQSLIGRLTIDGDFAKFELPTKGSGPSGLVLAPDHSVYITELIGGKIARLDWARKVIQEFPLRSHSSWPTGLALDGGGNLWFSMTRGDKIGRLSPSGAMQEFPMPTVGAHPTGLAVDARGWIWVAERDGGKIACLRPDATFVEYTLPTPDAKPSGITVDDLGRVWFAERNGNAIGVLDGDRVREYPLPHSRSGPFFVRMDYSGKVWFTEVYGNRIGVLTPESGSIREFRIPTPDCWPGGLAIDSQGNVWFTEQLGNKVGVLLAARRKPAGAGEGSSPRPDSGRGDRRANRAGGHGAGE